MEFVCQFCNQASRSLKNYLQHCSLHRNLPNFQFMCGYSECCEVFTKFMSLKSHMYRCHNFSGKQLHTKITQYSCGIVDCYYRNDDFQSIIEHVRMHLKKLETVECPFEGCTGSFKKYSSFNSHINRHHPGKKNNATCPTPLDQLNCTDGSNMADFEDENTIPEESQTHLQDDKSKFMLTLAGFYMKLEAKHLIPVTVIQMIAEEIQELINMDHEMNSQKVFDLLQPLNVAEDDKKLILGAINQSFLSECISAPLRSSHTRNVFYQSNFKYVPPIEVKLGLNEFQREQCMYYVPITQSLQSFCTENFSHLRFFIEPSNNLSDLQDGASFKANQFFQLNAKTLQVILYQDAFEIVNPLGSAKTKHKILAVYYSLANLPASLRSSVDHIQLALIIKEKNVKIFGFETILKPLIEDLRQLENVGILLDGENVKGSISCITGDNLGSHSIGGFLESFSGSYFCRYCLISKEEFKADPVFLGPKRTVENYKQCAENVSELPSFGIKSNSVFNSLAHFHVCNPGLPPCLGHDLFEGVVAFDLILFLKYFIDVKNWFSLTHLNRRINHFKYLSCDAKDKPAEINLKKKN